MIGYMGVVEAGKGYQKPSSKSSGKNQIVQTTRATEPQEYCLSAFIIEDQPRSSQRKVRELTTKIKNENTKSGGYERVTVKEKMSRGETHIERSTGRYGVADEYKKSSTVKIGDKTGYTEYYHEDRVRRVNYEGTGSSRLMQGSRNSSISVNHGGSGGTKKNSSLIVNNGKNKSTTVSVNYGGNKKSGSSGKYVTK